MKKIIFLILTLAFPSLAVTSKKLNKVIPLEAGPDLLSYNLLLKKFEKYENTFTIKNAYFQNECDSLGCNDLIEVEVTKDAINRCFEFYAQPHDHSYIKYTMLVCENGESFRIKYNSCFTKNSKEKKYFRKIVEAAVISMPHSKELDT